MFAAGLLVPTVGLLWILVGVVSGWAFVRLGRRLRGRRARVWWAGGLVLAALAYVVFALLRGDVAGAALEMVGVALTAAVARLGLRGDLRWLAVGWLMHPLWDLGVHPPLEAPLWYVTLCLGFDLFVGVALLRDARR